MQALNVLKKCYVIDHMDDFGVARTGTVDFPPPRVDIIGMTLSREKYDNCSQSNVCFLITTEWIVS